MRPRQLYLFYLFLLMLSPAAMAQVYTRHLASGNVNDFNKAGASGVTAALPRRTLKAVDTQALLTEDEQRTKLGLPDRMGVDIDVQADFMQIAAVTTEGNLQIARFQFDVPSAQGLSVLFNALTLASGAQLFIYNTDQTVLIGPVTEKQNGTKFWSDLVTGEHVVVELKEPLAVAGQSIVQVGKLIQYYRFVPKFGFNTSSSCEINTACYPAYQNEADGVAMLLTYYSPYTYACTGSMLNATQQNFRSFLLTAFHCFDFSGDGSLQTAERNAAASTQVRFHWESPVCSPTAADNVYLTLTGSTLQAAYASSDFTLLEINQQVPPSENITYLGWDRNNSNYSAVFGIHHPSADIKKISFSNNATSFIGTVMTTGGNYYTSPGATHLNVTWNASPNTLGVTEGGSSGSALFNADRRVVGQLHGGGSFCTSPTSPDQYGRIYTSWTGGGSPATRLSDWLNPAGSTATTTNSVKSQVSGPAAFVSTATFSLNSGSSITSWVVTGGNGVITPTSGAGNVASLTATGTATGATITFYINAGQSYPISFTKNINASAGENFPPIASTIPARTATVGSPFSYTVPAFTDPEGLPITYSAAGLPSGLSFNAATRVINGTPTASGTFVSSITGTDQGNLATSVAFLFTVNCPVTSINASAATVCL
ncbi:putative Ig domain-containing protein, partial [Arsenicibacter rosenii]